MRRLILALTGLLSTPSFVLASDESQLCKGAECGKVTKSLPTAIGDITNVLLLVAGAVAVIFLIIGGLRYITSTGEPARIKQAKDTVLYSIIGLVVVIVAYAVVRFVIRELIR